MILLVTAILLILGIVLLVGLTPEGITEDMMAVAAPKQTLRDQVKIEQGKKKAGKISTALIKARDALQDSGKGGTFAILCTISLLLMLAGGILSVVIGTVFLLPVLCALFAIVPFLYGNSIVARYQKHLENELETALSVITTSYERNDDIVRAVEENVQYIKPPVQQIFKKFLGECFAVNASIKTALYHLQDRVDNMIYKEWVEGLISCQDDRTLKDTLMPIVNKLSDVRIVNNELKTLMFEPRKEYYTMVALVVGNVPLLYMLNKDWFHTLVATIPGKLTLALTGLVILVTMVLMLKYTKPIDCKR